MTRAHDSALRQRALAMLRGGVPNKRVAQELNVPCGTIGYWLHVDRAKHGDLPGRDRPCPRCDKGSLDHKAYAYLLGLYLGDGHIIAKYRQHTLSVFCADAWPGLVDAAEEAMRTVLPAFGTGRRQLKGCTEVKSYSAHWPCLFPQHGPGKKYSRSIVLEKWQQDIVDEATWDLIRGLVHSDGCRVINWTTRVVQGRRRRYEYPRYLFTNLSSDILRIYTDALDCVGVEWRTTTKKDGAPITVSVARRASVALMDEHVGAKY